MASETVLRPAVAADLLRLRALVIAAYAPYVARIGRKPGPMDDDYAALIAAGQVHLLDTAGAIEGIIVLIPEADAMLLDNVAVAPDAQGRGLGRILISHAEQVARAAGHRALRLYTHERMTENIALYGRLGFVETHRAEEKGFRRVYMTKPLAPG